MCDCFHLAFPNWHAASSGTGGRRLRGPEAATEDDSVSDSTCDEPARFTEGERPRPQGSSPVEEFPETEKYTDSDKECEGEHDPQNKTGSGKKTKKSGLGSMFEKRSTPKMSKLKELPSPESGVIVKTAKDGCAEGLVYGGGGRDGIFIKGVVPESPASKSLKLKEGDQVLSATVYFDNVPYEDAIQILEHAQAYKMKLCLKRKPDISQTDAPNPSNVIPEDDIYAPEMREQGKTKRRGDARISWPKFPSFGKGRKAHFKRSHSSSEADEQRKLELSPTTSDTESPIKSQDALKGKKKNKMKLSALTKRGRISSSEDQDTITTGQISSDVQQTQESDMLSPECLESPPEDAPQVYVSKDVKSVGNLRLEQNNQTLTESGSPQHKAELISIDSTLKTTDLTVALANQDSQTSVKSPEGKKKKKEKSELKLKILGKDKSHKKAKSSPKRLKTLGASLEVSDQNDTKKSDVTPIEAAQTALITSKVELDSSDVDSKQKGEEKTLKSQQKQEAKPGAILKVGLGDATNEEEIRQVSVNVEEYKPKTELLKATGVEVKDHSYDELLKGRISSKQLPKREDIEIPGMEDKSAKTKVKGVKESKRHHEETVQMSIDVDSVKEAVSKLPGYKLPKVDTSGVPIPEEITVIDANAQRISVKTPTKVIDTKNKHEIHFTKFDTTACQDSSKTTIKLPKMRASDLTTQELLFETRLDTKKTQKQHKDIKTGAYEREDIIIPGRETTHSYDQTSDGIKGEKTIYLQDIKISKTETMTDKGWIGGFVSDVKIPEIDSIEFIDSTEGSPAKKDLNIGLSRFDTKLKSDASIPEITGEIKDVKAEEHTVQMPKSGELTTDNSVDVPGGDINIDGSEIKSLDSEGKGGKFKMPSVGISISKVKEHKTDLSPSKKDTTVTLPEAKAEFKCPQEMNLAHGSVTVSLPEQKMNAEKPELDIKLPQIEGELDAQGNKFKKAKFGIKMPKFESPTLDRNVSKAHGHVNVQDVEVKVKLPKAPEVDLTLGGVDVSIPGHTIKVEKTAMETEPLKIEGELDSEGTKFKLPKLGIAMPKVKGTEVDLVSSIKGRDVTLPEGDSMIRAPEAELKAKVEITAPEMKVVEKNAKGSPLKFKMPTFKLPKLEVGAPNISAEKPDVNIEGADIKIPKEGLEVNITAPSIDVVAPSINIKGNELDGKGGKFKIPSLGFSKPKVKGPKVDFSLSKKEVDVALPKTDQVEKDVSLSDVKMKMPDAEVKLPEMNLEVKVPEFETEIDGHEEKFKKPKFGIKLPEVKGPEFDFSLSKGEVDVKIPETQVKIPDVDPGEIHVSLSDTTIEVKKPELKMQPPEIEGHQGDTFKMTNFGIKMPKIKGPEIDLSQSKKDAGVKTPQIGVTVGKVELDEQENKMKMPKSGVSLPKVKGPEIHLGLSKKDPEVTAPEDKADVELEAPSAKIEVKAPQSDIAADNAVAVSSQFTMPTMRFSMPKIKGPDVHFRLPKTNADVKLPDVKAEVKLPEAPEIDVELESVDVSLPDAKMKLEKPELDVKMTGMQGEGKENKFKVPTFGISLPKVQGPEIDLNLSKRDVKLPEAKVDVKLPEAPGVDIDLGKVDVSIPKTKLEIKQPELETKPLEVEGQLEGSRFKMPKFGIRMPEIKGPKFDVSMSKKEMKLPEAEVKLREAPEMDVRLGSVDVSLPEAKMKLEKPELEIKPLKTEAELDGQRTKFKMPRFDITMPKEKEPEADVKLPEVKGEIKLPDIEVRKPSAEVEINAPEIKVGSKDTKASPLKFKLPTFKLPKFGVVVQGPDVDEDIEIEGANIKIPEEVLTVNIEAPKIDVKTQSIDIKTTEMKHEGKSGKFTVPSLGFKGPEVDINLQKRDVTLPEVKAEVKLPDVEVKKLSDEVEVKSPEIKITTKDKKGSPSKFKMPSFKMPKLGFGTPSVSAEAPDVDVKIPEEIMTVNIEAPSIEVQAPTIDIKTKEIELEGKGGKFKAPSFSIKGPDSEISKKDVKVPGVKAEVEVPGVGVDVKAPNAEGTGGKFKMPEFGITMPKLKGPDFNFEKKDVTLQGAKAEVDLPDVELKVSFDEVEGSKFNLPTITFPKLGAAAKVEGATMKIPTEKVTGNVEAPNVDLEAPLLDVKMTGMEGEGKENKFKVPTFGISLPKVQGPEIDLNLSKRDVKLPEAKVDVKLPEAPGVDIDLGKVDVSIPETKLEIKQPELEIKPLEVEGQLERSRFKMPKFGIKMPEIKGPKFDVSMSKKEMKLPEAEVKLPETPEMDVRLGSVDVSLPEAKMKLEKPELEIKPLKTEAELDGQGTRFKMPKFGVTMPKVKGPEVDFNFPKDTEGTFPEEEVHLPAVDVASAKVEIKGVDTGAQSGALKGSPSKFKLPTFKFPKIGVTTSNVSAELPDVDKEIKIYDADIAVPQTDIHIPEMKAEINLLDVNVKPSGTVIKPHGVEIDAKQKKSRFSLPRLSFSKPSIKVPEVDVNLQDVNVAIPEGNVEVKGGKIEVKAPKSEAELDGQGSKSKTPKLGITLQKVSGPDIDVSLKKKDLDVTLQEVKAEVEGEKPSAEVDIKAPRIKIETDGSPSKFKMPTMKRPKFGGGAPSVSAEVPDMNVETNGPNIEIPEEILTVNIDVPSVETKAPTIHIKTKGTEYDGKGINLKMSSFGFQGPEIDLDDTKDINVTLPGVKGEVELPAVEVKKPSAEIEIKGPGIDLKNSDIEGSPSKFKMPTFKLPKLGVGSPQVSVDRPDMDKDMKFEGADLKIKGPKVEVKLPDVEVKEPAGSISIPQAPEVDADAKSRKTSWTMPRFSFSKPSVKATETDVNLPKVEVSLQEGTVEVKQPDIEFQQLEGDVQLDGQKSKFKFPSLGFKGPEIDLSESKKDVEVKLPEVKAEVKLPDVEVKKPSADLDIKSPEIKMATKDTDGSPSKFKMPSFKLPKFGGGAPSVTAEIPDIGKDVKIEGADIKVPEEVLTVNIEAPSVKTKGPTIDVKTTGTEAEGKGSKFKFPSLGFKGPEVDVSLKDAEVKLPEVKAEAQLPDVKVKKPSAEVDIKSPGVDFKTSDVEGSPSKIKLPTFKFPKFGVGSPQVNVDRPDMDKDMKLEGTDLKIKGPKVEVKLPDVEVKEPAGSISIPQASEVDADAKSRKTSWTMPRFSFSKPSVKATEAEINLEPPTVDVSIPEGTVEVKPPGGDVQLDGQKSKFKFPSFGFKGPEIDLSVSKKDVEVKLPEVKAEVKLPDVEVKKPSAELEIKSPEFKLETKDTYGSPSKFKMPTFNMPKFGGGAPRVSVDVPDVDKDVKLEGADIKIPEEILTVNVEAPNIKTKGPTFDIKMTESEPERRGSKFRFPSLGFKGPEIDLSVSKKDVEVKLPEVKAEVKLPDVEVKKPSAEVDIKSPEIKMATKDTDGSPSKFKLPSFKLPKFGGGAPSVTAEIPDIGKDVKIEGADIKVPEEVLTVNIEAPSVKTKGPTIDVRTTGTEAEGKGSKFKFPSLGFKGPEVDVSLKDAEVKLPEVKAEAQLPDVKVKKPSAEVDIKSPGVDFKTSDVEGSPSKIKLPTFKFPKFGVGSPQVSVDRPDMDKDMKLEGADLKIKGPKVEVKLPDVEVKEPAGSISIPQASEVDADAKSRKTSWTMPRFSFSNPSVKATEAEINLEPPTVDVSIPEGTVEVKPPGGDVHLDGQKSKFKFPSFGFKGPEIDLGVSKKDVEVKLPAVKAEVKLPDVEVKKPSAELEIKSPEFKLETKDTDGSPSKFKMPTFNMPKFGGGAPRVSVDVPDVDKDVKLEGADIKIPEEILTVNVEAPNIKTKGPTFDIKMTESEPERRGSKFKFPSLGFKGPEIDLSESKKDVEVKLPEVKAEVKLPDVEVKKPSAEVDIKSPEIKLATKDTDGSPSKFKLPSFKLPKFGGGAPSVTAEIPDIGKDVKIERADIKVPEEVLTVNIEAPSVKTKGPTIDVKTTGTEAEGKGSKFKFPSLGFKGPEVDVSLKDVEVKLPEVKAEAQLPDVKVKKPSAEVDIKSPGVDFKTSDVEGSPSKIKLPAFKFPKFGVGSSQVSVDRPDMDKDLKLEGTDLKIKGPKVEVKLPDVEVKEPAGSISIPQAPEVDADAKSRKTSWTMPRFSFSKPSVKATEAEINLEPPTVDVSIPEGTVEVKPPGGDVQLDGQKSKFKFPSFGFKGPEIDLSVSKKDAEMKLPEVKAEVKLPDVEVKKPSAEVEIKSPEFKLETKDTDGSPSKFKIPSFNMPKFGGGAPRVSVDVPDVDKDVKLEGADIKIPEEVLTVNVEAPNIKTKGPTIDIKTTGTEPEGKGSKFKFPSLGFKGPEVDVSLKDVEVKLPEVKAEAQLPDLNIQKPLAKVKVKAPGFKAQACEDMSVDVKGQGGETEGSGGKFKLPSFGISAPKVKGPEIDVSLSKKDVTLPEVSSEVQLPEVEVKDVEAANSEAKAKRPSWTFPKLSFSKSSGKVPDADFNLETPKVDVAASEAKAEICLPDVEVKQSVMKVEVKPPAIKIKSAEIATEKLKISQKDVNILLPEVKLSEGEVKDIEAKSKDIGGSPLKFQMPTMKMLKIGGATQDVTTETPSAEEVAQIEGIKLQPDMTVTLKGPSTDIKTDVSKATTSGSETPNEEPDKVGPGSPSKFKLPSFKMPRLSFSRTKSEEENIPAGTEHREHEEEVKAETKEVSKSFGNILKTIDVDFDVPNTETVEDKDETSKEAKKQHDRAPGQQVDQGVTKSPERTGWFSFRFGLSSPSGALPTSQKDLQKNDQSPAGETGDEDVSPSCSLQSSDAFADVSSTVTSELVGPSISSPTKVTVKYSNPDSAVGPGEFQSNIITSMARTELISDMPNLPEKITILSSGVSSSSEDTLRLESGKIHVFTSNIQATPESQHARLLTAVQVQPSTSVSLTTEAKEASSWTMQDAQDGMKTVFERHLVKETSSERSESTETIVITKQISHVFESSEPISGETASSIQRLRNTVHSEKMKFFDEADK